MVWQEDGRYPDLIIELLSPATNNADKNEKKDLYQKRWRTPEYFWFSPDTFEFAGFRLVGGQYQDIQPNNLGRLWSEELGLYLGVENEQLRYFTPEGDLVPTLAEAATQAQGMLEAERQRSERLAARLRALGVEPEEN